jgi:hypothetical protein
MIKRNLIAATKPDILIEADGDNYTVSTITSVKTIKISFTLGKEYEADPGTDKVSTVNTFFLQFFVVSPKEEAICIVRCLGRSQLISSLSPPVN